MNSRMYKYSVLQYLFNGYDTYRVPEILDPECEYILVTDNPGIHYENIKVIIDDDLKKLPIWEKCYSVRFNLFKYCTTDVCIYLDANVKLTGTSNHIYKSFIESNADLGLLLHPYRSNIIHEYYMWTRVRGYPLERAEYVLRHLSRNGFDTRLKGLYEGKMRICKNTELNNSIDSSCFSLLKELSYMDDVERVDQTIYSVIVNNRFNDISVFPIFPTMLYASDDFKVYVHNSTNTIYLEKTFPYYYIFDRRIDAVK